MVFLVVTVISIVLSPVFQQADAADKENCLMCHKYRQLGRIDEQGRKRNYNVNERLYANSVHRNVPCRDCHTYITKLPHDPVKEEVDCANECHIKPPFAKENFSHKRIIEIYNESVHGIKPDDPPELKAAKPYCKYCHLNPMYTRVSEERIEYEKTLARCLNCHEERGVTQAYKHITHRLRHKTSRSPQEIVELCTKNCHADIELMKKFNVSKESLEAVETYNRSVHGKAVALGSQEAADCISCHATSAIHDIYKKDDPRSTVNKANLEKTCKQCHKNVNSRFIQIDVHSGVTKEEKPTLYYIHLALKFAFYVTVFTLIGHAVLETYGRKTDGIKWQLRHGTTWRGHSKRKINNK
jgi:nitrate/TMAO reductase-like tetraheme cytochrome c subunit